MPDLVARTVDNILDALPAYSRREESRGHDHVWRVADRTTVTIPPPAFVDNSQYATSATNLKHRSPATLSFRPVAYAVLHNARLSHLSLIVDQAGRFYRECVPDYVHEVMRRCGVFATETTAHATYEGERHIAGDTVMLPVGAPHMSHFFFEGLGMLAPFLTTREKVLIPLPENQAFIEQLQLAGWKREEVLFRPHYGEHQRPLDGGDCWTFDRLLLPLYNAQVCPSQHGVFSRITQAVQPGHKELLYVSRLDAVQHRRLLNEDEVVALFDKKGFEIVTCAKLNEPEKVSLFRGARIIAQPMGAGVWNSIFCDALQFHLAINSGTYDNWPMRSSVSVKRYPYGYHLGPEFLSYDSSHHGAHNDYVIDIPKLEARVNALLNS